MDHQPLLLFATELDFLIALFAKENVLKCLLRANHNKAKETIATKKGVQWLRHLTDFGDPGLITGSTHYMFTHFPSFPIFVAKLPLCVSVSQFFPFPCDFHCYGWQTMIISKKLYLWIRQFQGLGWISSIEMSDIPCRRNIDQ